MSSFLALSPPAPSHQPGLVPPPAVVAQPPFRGQAPTLSRLDSGPQVFEPCFSRPPYLLGAPLAVDRGAHADPARKAQTDASAGLIAVIATAAAAALVPEREKEAVSLRVLTVPAPSSFSSLSSSARASSSHPCRHRHLGSLLALRTRPEPTVASGDNGDDDDDPRRRAPPFGRPGVPSASLRLSSFAK